MWITKPDEKPQSHKTFMALESVQEEGGGREKDPRERARAGVQAQWYLAHQLLPFTVGSPRPADRRGLSVCLSAALPSLCFFLFSVPIWEWTVTGFLDNPCLHILWWKYGYLGPGLCTGAAFSNFLELLIRHTNIQATQLTKGPVPHCSVLPRPLLTQILPSLLQVLQFTISVEWIQS